MGTVVTIDAFGGGDWTSIDEFRLRMICRWHAALLCAQLVRMPPAAPPLREIILDQLSTATHSTNEELVALAPAMWGASEEFFSIFSKQNRPRVSWEQLGQDFRQLLRKQSDAFSRGIPVGWVAARFHLPAFRIHEEDLWHGRIGVGEHAGHIAMDEMSLLSDMFFYCLRAKQSCDILERCMTRTSDLSATPDWYALVTRVKSNACADSRSAVLCACSFIESLINGFGADHLARAKALSPHEEELLKGRQKGKWLTLPRRLEAYPQIIRKVKTPFFQVVDRGSRQEPFRTFFDVAVETRDGAMHPAEGKATIWLGPFEWSQLAVKAADSALAISRLLWEACKPGSPMPDPLWELDKSKLEEHARRRLEAERHCGSLLEMSPVVSVKTESLSDANAPPREGGHASDS